MIVVADTSPINYLLLIKEIDILPKMYGKEAAALGLPDLRVSVERLQTTSFYVALEVLRSLLND